MKIALIGTRGVPANYGGFETCAEEIAVRLVERGHEVTAYCRPGNAPGDPPEYRGVRLVYRGLLDSKITGTFSHTWGCVRHAMKRDFDLFMVFNAANAPLLVWPRLRGRRIVLNVDGLEWKRRKWGWFAKRYYRFCEWLSTKVSHRVISDARAIQDYYQERFRHPTTFIAYGGRIETSEHPEILKQYGLESGGYFLQASRLEPENHADCTVQAFERVETDKKFVIAGGANWKSPFIEEIRKTKDPRIVFLGPVYAPGHIKELHCHCYAYLHGNEVGGTNPALVKAMGFGNCVLALDNVFNVEVLRDAGIFWPLDPDALAEKIRYALDHPEAVAECRRRAVERIRAHYSWDAVAADHERLFRNVLEGYYARHPEND